MWLLALGILWMLLWRKTGERDTISVGRAGGSWDLKTQRDIHNNLFGGITKFADEVNSSEDFGHSMAIVHGMPANSPEDLFNRLVAYAHEMGISVRLNEQKPGVVALTLGGQRAILLNKDRSINARNEALARVLAGHHMGHDVFDKTSTPQQTLMQVAASRQILHANGLDSKGYSHVVARQYIGAMEKRGVAHPHTIIKENRANIAKAAFKVIKQSSPKLPKSEAQPRVGGRFVAGKGSRRKPGVRGKDITPRAPRFSQTPGRTRPRTPQEATRAAAHATPAKAAKQPGRGPGRPQGAKDRYQRARATKEEKAGGKTRGLSSSARRQAEKTGSSGQDTTPAKRQPRRQVSPAAALRRARAKAERDRIRRGDNANQPIGPRLYRRARADAIAQHGATAVRRDPELIRAAAVKHRQAQAFVGGTRHTKPRQLEDALGRALSGRAEAHKNNDPTSVHAYDLQISRIRSYGKTKDPDARSKAQRARRERERLAKGARGRKKKG